MKILIPLSISSVFVLATACGTPSHSHGGLASHPDHVKAGSTVAKVMDRDSDGDGIPDIEDNCPGIAGTAENFGCVEKQLVVLRTDRIEILEKVYFATGSDQIEERSHALLVNIANVLKSHPAIDNVRIEGHTDNTGDAAFNLDLSQRRAASVVNFLVEKGVSEAVLNGKGFGPERPIKDNESDEGRAANRRVEFVIVHSATG